MTLHQMTCRQCTTQREFTGKNTSSNDASEFACVVARVCGMRAADTKHIKTCGLGLENGAAAEGADFNGRHGDADLKVAAKTDSHISDI